MRRDDVSGFTQRMAWLGHGTYPFGLFSCPGWAREARKLSDRITSISRRGQRAALINVRPSSEDDPVTLSVSIRASGMMRRRAEQAIEVFRARCSISCQICGGRAKAVRGFGVYCRKHFPMEYARELLADARAVRRERRRWAAESGVRITTRHARIGAMRLPVYLVDGEEVVRVQDASPGCRAQLFDGLVDDGILPIEVGGHWVFRTSACTIIKRVAR